MSWVESELKSTKVQQIASCHNEWKNYENAQEMYELVYEHMIAAWVDESLPELEN